MQSAVTFPTAIRPVSVLLLALKSRWQQGPAPSWTEYLRATRG
ncbi:hypothetical protein [Celeribacter indicus]|nr:hypothetical protein [Celeribacter indicus]SDX00578.1 hypothetical protein SAMN05443573_11150 [Celeribacter indicus]